MLLDIFDHVVERGSSVMANHLFGDLRQFFDFAVTRDWIDSNPLNGISKDKVGRPPKERDRYLSEDEIIELKLRLPTANLLQTTEIAIWIMLSTCCRVGEISRARWEHIDLEASEWFIPAGISKNAKPHAILLSEFSKHQFEQLHTITGDSEWCLPTRGGNNHVCLKSIAKQIKDRVRDDSFSKRTKAKGTLRLPGGDWTPHDLRRTGATMMGELGVMGEIIERCLNHVEQNKLKRIYQRQERKAEQHEAWRLLGERLELLLNSSQDSNIVIGHFRSNG
jgi:integrase